MKKIALVLICCALITCTGCPHDDDPIAKFLLTMGFVEVTPPQSGIMPGQIWDGAIQHIYEETPPNLTTTNWATALKRLHKDTESGVDLSALFSSSLVKEIGQFGVAITNAGVTSIDLDFGSNAIISRILLDDLDNPATYTNFSQSYREILWQTKKESSSNNYRLIAATLKVSGMSYTFTCTNTNSFAVNVPTLTNLLKGDFNLRYASQTTVVLNIPADNPQVIGTMPLSGDAINLPEKLQIKAIQLAAKTYAKQLSTSSTNLLTNFRFNPIIEKMK